MKTIYKITFIAILILAAFVLYFYLPSPSASASTGNWYGDPFVIREYVNSQAYLQGYSLIPSAYENQGAMNYDNGTALKICQIAGFNAVESMGCVSPAYQSRCGFTSCEDNVLARWNSSTNNWDIGNACSMGNVWISTLVCKNTCTSHASQKCVGNAIYWFDSCNNQQELVQTCLTSQTCQNAQCVSMCTTHTSKQCVGNSVYWFNSCGLQEDLYQACTANQTCLYGQCVDQSIQCYNNNNCGVSTPTGLPYCQGNAVYQNYIVPTCNNPGTPQSSCSSPIVPQLVTTCTGNQICSNGTCISQTIACSSNSQCGTDGYINSPFCQNGNVYQDYKTWTCNNPGTPQSSCSSNVAPQLKSTCSSGQTCTNGSCTAVLCSTNSQCGTDGYINSPFCQGGNVYQDYRTWICNNPGTANSSCSNTTVGQLKTTCSSSQTCSNGSCVNQNILCSTNSDCGASGYSGSQYCQGNSIYRNYITYTCNNPGTPQSSCSNHTDNQLYQTCTGNQTCQNGSCSGQNCTYHSYQQCSGNYLYWYDSCGVQQDSTYCPNGCSNNVCCGSGNNTPSCTSHAYKLCTGNNIYWFNSCGVQQDFYQACSSGQICQYGQCVSGYQPPVNPYIAHYVINCYGSNLYWYDSLGVASGLYRDCSDNNSCTIDACASKNCSNTLKCDGSTCITNSADYNKYCAQTNCGNGLCETNLGETSANCAADCKIQTASNLSITFFGKTDAAATQWNKTIQVNSDGTAYFLITIFNNSNAQADDVSVMANVPSEIGFLGNLKVNDTPVSGDIVSGINIGSLSAGMTKTITFEGKSQTISSNATKQATATINQAGTAPTDSLTINFSSGQVAGAVSQAPASSGIMTFLKRWYLWILVALVLLFLFIVVFRRLSSNN